jgi:hypothetical protein
MEAARTDDDSHVLRTEAGETYTVPLQCELPPDHTGEHQTTSKEGELYYWSD